MYCLKSWRKSKCEDKKVPKEHMWLTDTGICKTPPFKQIIYMHSIPHWTVLSTKHVVQDSLASV